MLICRNCRGKGCAVCNSNGVIGEWIENLVCTRARTTDADRAKFVYNMAKFREKRRFDRATGQYGFLFQALREEQ